MALFSPSTWMRREKQVVGATFERGESSRNVDQTCTLYTGSCLESDGWVGVGWLVTDAADRVVCEGGKCLGNDVDISSADFVAVQDGIADAITWGVDKIHVSCNSPAVFSQVFGSSIRNTDGSSQLNRIQEASRRLKQFSIELNPGEKSEHTTTLARDAVQKYIETSAHETLLTVECSICCESVLEIDLFEMKECFHRFCIGCLDRQVRSRLESNQVPVKCPEDCSCYIDVHDCRDILHPELVECYARSLAEAIIPESQRLYCPFPNCSSLIWKEESSNSSRDLLTTCTECMECHRLFCAECNVPWHPDMTCKDYQALPPDMRNPEDVKLLNLAKNHKWQRCRNCQSMVELKHGCNHITCRCGYEFCYLCGVAWVNKNPCCKCKLWSESNIRY